MHFEDRVHLRGSIFGSGPKCASFSQFEFTADGLDKIRYWFPVGRRDEGACAVALLVRSQLCRKMLANKSKKRGQRVRLQKQRPGGEEAGTCFRRGAMPFVAISTFNKGS